MNKVFLVYKESGSTRTVIGVATSLTSAISACKEQACKEGNTLGERQLSFLQTDGFTNGYSGDGEFHFETVETDTLL